MHTHTYTGGKFRCIGSCALPKRAALMNLASEKNITVHAKRAFFPPTSTKLSSFITTVLECPWHISPFTHTSHQISLKNLLTYPHTNSHDKDCRSTPGLCSLPPNIFHTFHSCCFLILESFCPLSSSVQL